MFPTIDKAPTAESWLTEMSEGLPMGDEEEDESEESEEDCEEQQEVLCSSDVYSSTDKDINSSF